ncbi:TetR/AcrR family transcriptional regulator [Acidisoma cellulosilytica]|uniref:TetR/AcrR family transcriptional regulator n=2 Tax=Acidisoma cellulosilyticum TaxID=2802395 RepID=A0A963Z3Z7_9PROT|nr:TetR/AcrR family transcriptional regulator [Acidisoma cellulosilyticum]
MSGVSIDDVARNSGVAKTTIYRHWPSRSALLIDACSRIGGPQAVPDKGNFGGDLRVLTTTVAEQLRTAAWPAVLPSIIDAAERDSEIAAMQSALHEGNMAPFYAIIERAKERGEIPSDRPAADLIAATLGPLFYRRWFSKETIDDRFVDTVIDAVVKTAIESGTQGAAAADAKSTQPSPARRSGRQKSR